MSGGRVIFDPALPLELLAALAGLALAVLCLAAVRRLGGWVLRAAAALVLLSALLGPMWQSETRVPLSDIVIALIDETASQQLGTRTEQTQAALEGLRRQIATRPNTELHEVRIADGSDNSGTRLMGALNEALAELPGAQVAGVVAISDGRLHDAPDAPGLDVPLHLLRTGQPQDWDRRVTLKNAPAFAILGEELQLVLRVDDLGAGPGAERVPLSVSVDGAAPLEFVVPLNQDLTLPVTLDHAGLNVLQVSTAEAEGELTARNNSAVVQINGVRDRLRVLLVSGEPHPGTRTWRNLLKSDASVDLVHFTILRPPEKQDSVPVSEMSLIAFPTRELFLDKIDEFDLIIFDRYQRRGILPSVYLENVQRYVRDGGAVLVAAGPDYASALSLYRSPLGQILPAAPTARVIETPFRPALSALGQRHPVTRALDGADSWGRWMRQVELTEITGDVLLTGAQGEPLLVLAREGEGRVALLGSDQAWLWARGYEGGGPQAELLRRLSHWLMQEPELEEEALVAEAEGLSLRVIRRSLAQEVDPVTITAPDGSTQSVTLSPAAQGRFEALWQAPEMGLYRLSDGSFERVIALGPAAPIEFEETIAGAGAMAPLLEAYRGGNVALDAGLPRLRDVRPGRPASGPGWIGVIPREASLSSDPRITPVLPVWVWLVLSAGLMLAAWLREGRR